MSAKCITWFAFALILCGCATSPAQTPLPSVAPVVLITETEPALEPVSQTTDAETFQGTGPQASATAENASTPVQDTTLTLDSLELVPPDDVIQELGYFGGFGGRDSDCDGIEYQSPTILSKSGETEIMRALFIEVCGLPVGEKVSTIIRLPNGSTRNHADVISEEARGMDVVYTFGVAFIDFIPQFQDPEGDYQFTISGDDWSLEYSVHVSKPAKARFYYWETTLFLLEFQPSETVQILVYKNVTADNGLDVTVQLQGWKKYQVDQNGNLVIPVKTNAEFQFVAIGEISGVLSHDLPDQLSPWAWLGSGDFYCVGSPEPAGVIPGKYAQVVTDGLPLIDQDGTTTNLLKGTILSVQSNPTCKDKSWWWDVSCVDSICNGTVQEGDSSGPYLQPLDELPPTPTFAPQVPIEPYYPLENCVASRMKIGMVAELVVEYLSFRNAPDAHETSNKIGKLYEGELVTIIGGPECSYDWIMWQVRTQDGREGWVAESDGKEFWLKTYEAP